METRLETPTRQRWREILDQYAESGRSDHRRTNERHYLELGSVKLTYEEGDAPVVRAGRLLNASDSGLMVKQYQDILPKTELQIEAAIGDEAFTLTGHVVHCTQTLGGFKIGIELQFPD